jgi:hypothetical protein
MMPDTESDSANASIDLNNITGTTPSVVYANTQQEVIVVTKDKLNLCLSRSVDRMVQRDRWLVPLGILVPLILTVATSGFTKRFGISGAEWETVFVMLIIFTIVWLAFAIRGRSNAVTVESIVEELAKNPVKLAGSPDVTVHDIDTGTGYDDQEPVKSINDTDSGEKEDEPPPSGLLSRGLMVSLQPGDKVEHDKFGLGTVLETSGSEHANNLEAKIDFGNPVGIKHLVIRFAPLQKL